MKATNIKREKLCRSFGQKMLLRPERCASPKCAFTRRSYPPGVHGQSARRREEGGYGGQLREKQRLRVLYGISERALKQTVRDALFKAQQGKVTQNALDIIADALERRLDNVVYRLGFAPSRAIARQLVSHGHILVNGRRVTTPSFLVRVGTEISIRPQSAQRAPFVNLASSLKKHRVPAWLALDADALRGKVIGEPIRDETMEAVDLAKVVEFYAR
jgi:small subunit ribosomal protein S4